MYKVFIIEDDKKIREELKILLEKYGYEILFEVEFENIIEKAINSNSDLILLDLNLPVYDGYYIFKEVRKKSEVPIIVVTSRDSDVDELISMNLGADDFISKPYNKDILLARINSVIKRTYKNNFQNFIEYDGLRLNLINGTIRYLNSEVELTKNELRILKLLLENKGKVVSRNEIINFLWQSDEFIDDNTLTVNITRLRKKIEDVGISDFIKTRRGMGYIV